MGRLIQILKHPATGILIGAVIAFGLFYLSRKEVSPKFAISETKLLAEVTSNTPRLQLLWDGTEIPNVYSVNVAIWNNGRKCLDKKDISATDPVRLQYPENIDILFHKFSHTSRSNLSFNSILNEKLRGIVIEMNGDEALERGDGGVLNILYSGPEEVQLSMVGRIKGVPNGFLAVDWNDVVAWKWDKISLYNLLIVIAVQFIVGFVFIIGGIRRFRREQQKRVGYIFVVAGLFTIALYSYIFYYGYFSPLFFGLGWAP